MKQLKHLTKEQLAHFVVLLRYQKQSLDGPLCGCMTYANIGQIVRRSGNYCRVLCEKYVEEWRKHQSISRIYS